MPKQQPKQLPKEQHKQTPMQPPWQHPQSALTTSFAFFSFAKVEMGTMAVQKDNTTTTYIISRDDESVAKGTRRLKIVHHLLA